MTTIELAKRLRIHVLNMTSRAGSAHIGSMLSAADIVAVLYGDVLRIDPSAPQWSQRDRFVMSKGHAGAVVYAALAERGFFPVEELATYYQNGSRLGGHISHHGVPGVEMSFGSLGHGLPVATGMAYGAKVDGASHRIFVLLSDGECDEGSNWEAILFCAHHALDNIVAIVDYNKIQSLDTVASTLALEPFLDKWQAFGWHVKEVDGHSHTQIHDALQGLPWERGKPSCLIAHTIKGKGVSFMEDSVLWHYRAPRGEEYDRALQELTRSP
jgi:transketolase